jgi:hypothetical protein
MVIFMVVPQEADLVQNHHVRGGSECDFQEAMPEATGKADDGRLTVVDAVALTKLIVCPDASPALAYGSRGLVAGWLRGHTEKDLGEEVPAFDQIRLRQRHRGGSAAMAAASALVFKRIYARRQQRRGWLAAAVVVMQPESWSGTIGVWNRKREGL